MTVQNACEVAGDWTTTGGGAAVYSGFNREGTNCVGEQISTNSEEMYDTITAKDFSAKSVHGWFLMWNAPNTFANAAFGFVFGDGTNRIAYSVGGTGTPDVQGVFMKNGWVSFQFDCSSPPTTYVTLAGSEASLDWANITQIGFYFDGTQKSLGPVDNVFIDALWEYDNSAYTVEITAGTGASPATFSDLADYDFSSAASRALGVMYEVDSGVFEVQAPIMIGDDGTAASYFKSENEEIIFIDKPINNYKFNLIGNATGQNECYFTGVTFRNTNSSVNPTFDWNDANFEYIQIDACSFLAIGTIDLPTTSANRFVTSSVFDGCGLIDPSTVKFEDNTVRNHTTTGLSLANPTTQGVKNCLFQSSGAGGGHAIEITAIGTYTFDGLDFVDYGADATSDAAVYNNSGGHVIINVQNASGPTVLNGSGATTDVVLTVNLKLTVKDADGNAIVGASVFLEADTGGPDDYLESVTITSSGTVATVTHNGHNMADGEMVNIRGANEPEYNGAGKVITYISSTQYSYVIAGAPASPATGTITSTHCYISELTIAGGIAEQSYAAGATQPARGWVRDGTPPDVYVQAPLGITDISGGIDLPVQLGVDE